MILDNLEYPSGKGGSKNAGTRWYSSKSYSMRFIQHDYRAGDNFFKTILENLDPERIKASSFVCNCYIL